MKYQSRKKKCNTHGRVNLKKKGLERAMICESMVKNLAYWLKFDTLLKTGRKDQNGPKFWPR